MKFPKQIEYAIGKVRRSKIGSENHKAKIKYQDKQKIERPIETENDAPLFI